MINKSIWLEKIPDRKFKNGARNKTKKQKRNK